MSFSWKLPNPKGAGVCLGLWEFATFRGQRPSVYPRQPADAADPRGFQSRAKIATTADHDDTAIVGQKLGVMGKVHVSEHFQNDVHAAVVCRSQNFFLISGFAVIENLMRPLSLVPRTIRPMARAIWSAAMPTPPLAPCTSAVSEACAFAE
jgi:hypothetical protein